MIPGTGLSPSAADLVAGSSEPLIIADIGAVRILIFNRPAARNALTRQMRRDFSTLIAQADADPTVAVTVITGVDPAFSGGVDLKERGTGEPPPPVKPDPAEVLRDAAKPVIAAVNGACLTGALEMALSASFIIASDRARFADTHAKLGLFPSWGQTALLPRAVGTRRALQMMLTGMFVDAETAFSWGLVNELVPHERLLTRAIELGQAIAAADGAAVRRHLNIVRETEKAALSAPLALEDQANIELLKRAIAAQQPDR